MGRGHQALRREDRLTRQNRLGPCQASIANRFGADIFTLTPDEFGKFLKSEIARWKGVVAKYRLNLDL